MILIEPTMQAKFGRTLRQRALASFLREVSEAVGLRGDVSVLLTGDQEMRRLNREFRHKDRPTDVLSFPAAEAVNGHPGFTHERTAGDLAISVETAAHQAQEFGHPLAAELQILLLHGALHLGGYDHAKDDGRMLRKEASLRRRFGLTMGLIERSRKPSGHRRGGVRSER